MKYSRNTRPFEVPLRIRIAYFLAPRRWLIKIGFVVLIVLAGFGLLWMFTIVPVFTNAAFAGLFGVVIGAVITGYISIGIQSQQFQAEALIRKKWEIYEPLYNALQKTKEALEKYPYPTHFEVDPDQGCAASIPRFVEWTRIKKGSSVIQVPKWIAEALGQYIEDIETYLRVREEVADAVHFRVSKIFRDGYGLGIYKSCSAAGNMLREIILGRSTEESPTLKGYYDKIGISYEVDPHTVILEECNKLEPVTEFTVFYQEAIVEHTNWLIRELARIIRYINIRYENQSGSF